MQHHAIGDISMHKPPSENRALTIIDAARYLGIHRTTIYRLAHSGQLSIRKIGGRAVLLRDELDRYLNNLPVSVGPKDGT